ncbi:MAG: fumarylacetoacetate hydrolase family protein [Rhodocyclales bacterium]|nr:fumarylacetoacetate hydrolase family protein [Rhodocyclales bacterium]
MDQSRRDLLKLGAGAMGGALMGVQFDASAQGTRAGSPENVKSVALLASQVGLRFATCKFKEADAARIGIVLDDGRVLDVEAQARRQGMALVFSANSMISLIASGDKGMAQAKALADKAVAMKSGLLTVNQVTLLSPVPKPERNIYCVGWNYLEHFEEGRDARADKGVSKLPDNPVFFTKGTHTMNGPFAAIPYDPSFTQTADWEAELAVVIGKKGRNIPEDKAMEYVFGYAAFNDTTVREVQQKRHGGQWFKGKSLDGYGPMGPWIVTAAGVTLDDVRIICRVNGVEKQNASYKQMYFKIPRIIAELSRGLTLEPGDIIATGTPPGVGYSRKPPEFLKPGDIMETEITGVGVIRNTIETEA